MNAVERRTAAILILLAIVVFVAAGVHFAAFQNVWVDESTQLSGITLSPGNLLAWLAGTPVLEFGVPADRMPPVSYMIDWSCARTLCSDETHFRWLHLAITAAGVALMIALAAVRYGWRAGAATAAFLILSPKLVELAVEVRAYPIFFAITCAQIWQLYRLCDQPRLRPSSLLVFLLLSVAALYTHFFALISSLAMLAGLFMGRLTDRRDAALVAGTGVLLLLCAVGLVPFITGASDISRGGQNAPVGPAVLAEFALKLLGHPANLLSTPAAALFFLGVSVLLLVSLSRVAAALLHDWRTALRQPLVTVVVALAAGLGVTLAAALVVKGFDPLKVTYSLWTFPLLALLVGAALAPADPNAESRHQTLIGKAAAAAGVLFAIGAAWGLVIFLSHARWFVHGPGEAIVAELRHAPDAAVVYRGQWGYGFFPTYFAYRETRSQWLLGPDGKVRRLIHGGSVSEQAMDPQVALGGRPIVLADIELEGWGMLKSLYDGAPESSGTVGGWPIADLPGWQAGPSRTLPGFYWTRLTPYVPAAD